MAKNTNFPKYIPVCTGSNGVNQDYYQIYVYEPKPSELCDCEGIIVKRDVKDRFVVYKNINQYVIYKSLEAAEERIRELNGVEE